MDKTENLQLPYIMPSQAQKHVTHNEAIRQLDAIIHLSVLSMDLSDPPEAPDIGARYIVGSGATGQWLEKDGQVASFADGFWQILEPQTGWLAYVEDSMRIVVFGQNGWEALPIPKSLVNLEGVGIGATPDSTNKLVVGSDATLLTHAGTNHQLKINKAGPTQTASILFQSDWIGQVEMGLVGDNDFQFKVSEDGTTFKPVIQIDHASGEVAFPAGARVRSYVDVDGQWQVQADKRWVTFDRDRGYATGEFDQDAGTGVEPSLQPLVRGPLLRRGSNIQRFWGSFRTSSNEVNSLNIRLKFMYGPWGQSWTDSTVTLADLMSVNNHDVVQDGFSKLERNQLDYVCPEDGYLLVFIQPVGNLSTTRQVYSSMNFELLCS